MQPVAILIHRLGPYHRSRLNAAAQRFPTVAVEVSSIDNTYAWEKVTAPELQRITVFEDVDAYTVPRRILAQRVGFTLQALQPCAVAIPGWSDPAALAALRWCAGMGTPVVMMSESQTADGARQAWKEAVKARLLRLCGSALVGGGPHAAYLQSLGMSVDRIFQGYDVVDNEHFARGADRAREGSETERRRLGLPDRFFLASSRFVEKKNLMRLVASFARFRRLSPAMAWKLVMLGDGPLLEDIKLSAKEHGIGDDLLLPGFQQYDALPAYYGLASAFIHASTVEQWGLVVNEAMAAGLPVLVSDRCGCAADLVRNRVNGFTFDPFDIESITRRMLEIASPTCDRVAMGAQSRRIIAEWSPARFAAALAQAVNCSNGRTASLFDTALIRFLIHRNNECH